MNEPPVESWQDTLDAFLRERKITFVRRAMVYRETSSTQEVAKTVPSHPTLVVADRQTAGRGRLGRPWVQGNAPAGSSSPGPGLGIAVTFALPDCSIPPPKLSLAAGLAAHAACAQAIPDASILGLRWPNDVVERRSAQRKLAGVLVETTARGALVGIGINVFHEPDDFPGSLSQRAVSLRQLGSGEHRLRVLMRLVEQLERTLAAPAEEITRAWSQLDILVGSRRTMIHAGRRYEGTVRAIQPSSHIELETGEGLVQLPSLTTSLVHEE
ncbi:MAG: biotin--[acetyl-CoA-carboxylase] ligase [Planctomycetes bacterium]|nr:biotin--[acetyl-CoA-carboxylase] ligase [Planctomycetota bacterium]